MIPDEWKELDEKLVAPWGIATLIVDGVRVDFQVRKKSKMTYTIMTFVNGEFKGEWLKKDHEMNKYCNHCYKFLWKQEARKKFKRQAKRLPKGHSLGIDPDQKYDYYSCYWNSVAAIKSQYQKRFKEIKLEKVSRVG